MRLCVWFAYIWEAKQNPVMKYINKPAITILSAFLFIFCAKTSFAQYPGMAAVRQQQTMQLANQQMNSMMQMMMMRGVYSSNEEFDFQVTLKDSTTKVITSAIYTDTVIKKRFIVLVDKKFKKSDTNRYKRIYPSQTLKLTCVLIPKDEDNPGSYLNGIITDSCWMFKTISGHINAYSYVIWNMQGPMDHAPIIGIQLNNGPIVAFTNANMTAMVGNNTKALELIADKKYLRAIKKFNRDNEPGEK